jgi:hypothetical protein
MKITVETTVKKQVEIPQYFKTNSHTWWMLVGNNAVVRVHSYSQVAPDLDLFPKIEAMSPNAIKHYVQDSKIEPISEAEFKHAYIMVSLEIENLMN